MMLALLKKDWRVNLVPTLGGFILVSITYLYMLVVIMSRFLVFQDRVNVLATVQTLAVGGSLMTMLLAAAYGGAAFASERRERSGDFLNMMPVTRRDIILSKLIMAGICLTGLWIYCWSGAVMLELLRPAPWSHMRMLRELPSILGMAACSAWLLFSVGWLCSTFLESAAIAASISIAVTITSAVLNFSIADWLRIRGDTPAFMLASWMLFAGTICFIVGTRYYLRRIEP